MIKTDAMPMWVFLAFSSIETRKTALILIWSSVLFSFYCVPWVQFAHGNEWVAKLFLIEDWSWFPWMAPMVPWYWLSLRWVDKHMGWQQS